MSEYDDKPSPLKNILGAMKRADKEMKKVNEKIEDEYNQVAWEQTNRLRDEAHDEIEFRIIIYAITKMEIEADRTAQRLRDRQKAAFYRALAESLIHKADSCEKGDAEVKRIEGQVERDLKDE